MPTTLKVLGWEAVGLRCPDHTIQLQDADDQAAPITLIQMPNGTGKTTTLNLIRAALAGQPADGPWTAEKVRALRKRDNWGSDGVFTLRLLHDSKRLTFEIKFNFDDGNAQYTTTYQSGIEYDHQPPADLRQYLSTEFVNFFVFDGELANNLLNRQQTKAGLAINHLFQLSLIREVGQQLQDYWMQQTAARTARHDKGFTQRRNRVIALTELLANRTREYTALIDVLKVTEKEIEDRRQRFDKALAAKQQLTERLENAKEDVRRAHADMEEARQKAQETSREPHALSAKFALEMLALKDSFDRVKLPESTAREFFDELADEPSCVCGRPLDAETSAYIRRQAARYLGSDDMILLNQVKSEISQYVGADPDAPERAFQEILDTLRRRIRDSDDARQEYNLIESEGVQDDPELEAAQQIINERKQKVQQIQGELRRYDESHDNSSDGRVYSIAELKRRCKDAEKKLAEVTETVTLRKKCELLKRLLDHAQTVARDQIRDEIRDRTNETIAKLLPNNDIRVAAINDSVVLKGQEAGSVGETLSVGYAFLATLFGQASQTNLPFVVDSPAGSLDRRVRAEVAKLIPSLGDQYIAFVISTEREGFLDALEAAAPGKVRYFTLFRKGDPGLDSMASSESDAVSTADGWCVLGPDFFQRFHVDTEDVSNAVQAR